jgi:hypothetical protein
MLGENSDVLLTPKLAFAAAVAQLFVKAATNMNAVAKRKSELWVSLAVALAGFLLTAHAPKGFVDLLIIAGTQVIALLCALNALLDLKRMLILEGCIVVPWFCFLLYSAPSSFWWAATLKFFADR